MKTLIFGGAAEGRLLAGLVPALGHDVTVQVATELGAEELKGCPCRVRTGRLDAREMTELVREFDLVIDATHPYAAEASRNIRQACRAADVPLRRVLRAASEPGDCVRVGSCGEAADYLSGRPGNVLIATGSKELPAYGSLDPGRLYPRVLPTHEALSVCEKMGIAHSHILALQGPFSLEMNAAMLRQYRIRYLVTKDGGKQGGFEEKREAARRCGAELILVARPEDSGISMEELMAELEGMA